MDSNQYLFSLLQKIGLSGVEAKLYLFVRKHPGMTLRQLQQKMGISKTSLYRSYERLRELHFLKPSEKNWRKEVHPFSLAMLANEISKKQREFRKIELALKKAEFFVSQSDSSETVSFLTTADEIKEKSYEIVRRDWDHMLCYGSAERLIDIVGSQEEHDFVRMRKKKGKSCDAFLTEVGDYAREFLPRNEREFRSSKIQIDPKVQNYCIYIYDREVTIWERDSELGNRALVLRDPLLVSSYENMFLSNWKKDS